jgi:exosortase/archaeosortase
MKAQALAEYALLLALSALLMAGLFDVGRAALDVLRLIVLRQAVSDAAAAGAQAGMLFPECASTTCADIVGDAAGAVLAGFQLAGAPTVIISESVIRETTIPALRVQVCATLEPVSLLGGLLAGDGLEACAVTERAYRPRAR